MQKYIKAGLVYLTLVPTVFAQSADQYELEQVTVTAFRVEQGAFEFAGSLSAIDEESLELTSHHHIQEALSRVPGVNFHRNSGQEYLAAVRSPVLTGSGSCGSLMTAEDGLSIRPVGFCNVNELFEAHTEQAQRIELIRGPGTVIYGSKAMHGVVNVIAPVTFERPPSVTLEAGAYGFARVKALGNTTLEKGSQWGASFTGTTESGYRDDSGYEQQKLSVRNSLQKDSVSIDTRLTATHLDQQTAGFIVGQGVYKDNVIRRSNANPEAFRKAESVRLSSRISAANDRWQIQPYARFSKMEFLQHFLPGQPLEENGQHSLGVLSQYRFDLADTIEMVAGVDLEYADSWLRQSQDSPTEGSLFLQNTIPQGRHFDYQVESNVVGGYLQADWRLNDKFKLGLGWRLEQVEYRYENLMLDGRTKEDGGDCAFGGCRYSRPADQNNSFSNFSPKLSLSYILGSDMLLFINHSNAYRVPEITELYRLQRDQQTADLEPEELVSVEAGWRFDNKKIIAELVLFDMQKSNQIFRDIDFFNVSNGETQHRGMEFSYRHRFSERYQWDVSASYAEHKYANNPGLSELDIIGNDIDTAPRFFGSSRFSYISQNGISVELEWQHLGNYFTDPENFKEYPGHDLINVRTAWTINEHWKASFRLNNLFDVTYAERADFSQFSGDRYLPGMPRRAYLSLQYVF